MGALIHGTYYVLMVLGKKFCNHGQYNVITLINFYKAMRSKSVYTAIEGSIRKNNKMVHFS
jgi:hypothetical protein